jgi:hypothetical protein
LEQFRLFQQDSEKTVSLDTIITCPTFKDSLKMCKMISGHDDKQIAMQLDIDQGQWSRIFSGVGHFPENKLVQYMKICGNKVPLIWLNYHSGYAMQPLKSGLEMENDRLKAELDKIKDEMAAITKFMKEIK